MNLVVCDDRVRDPLVRYISLLSLPVDDLDVTTDRPTFARWIGRRSIRSSIWGAYCFVPATRRHAVLINLDRIDVSRPHGIDVVVAEELLHMRDHIDGDMRRHAHHGHDRIARRVSALTGVALPEIRSALLPVRRRPARYQYGCPRCGLTVYRRRRGTWSCGRCGSGFDRRFILKVVKEITPPDRLGQPDDSRREADVFVTD